MWSSGRIRRIGAAVLVVGVVLAGGAVAWRALRPHEGTAETDRIAKVVSDAVASPRQRSADGYLRALLSTPAAQDGRLSIVDAERTGTAGSTSAPYARFTYLVHLDASESGFSSTPAVDACYDVRFGFYGATSGPSRTGCPDDLTPVTSVPGPAEPDVPVNPTAGG